MKQPNDETERTGISAHRWNAIRLTSDTLRWGWRGSSFGNSTVFWPFSCEERFLTQFQTPFFRRWYFNIHCGRLGCSLDDGDQSSSIKAAIQWKPT